MSDISLACRQVGPIKFKAKFEQGDDVFRRRRSLLFKKMQIVRGCDVKRNVLVYMVYSDRIIEGSPKNSTSTRADHAVGREATCRNARIGSSSQHDMPAHGPRMRERSLASNPDSVARAFSADRTGSAGHRDALSASR